MREKIDLNIEKYDLFSFLYYKTSIDNIDVQSYNALRSLYIPNLMPIQIISKGDASYIRYDLICENNITTLIKDKNNKETISFILSNIIEIISEISKLGLDIENIILDKEYMFFDPITKKIQFVYIPIKEFEAKSRKITLKDFIKELVLAHSYDENDDLLFFVKIHNYLINSKEIKVEDTIKFLRQALNINSDKNIDIPKVELKPQIEIKEDLKQREIHNKINEDIKQQEVKTVIKEEKQENKDIRQIQKQEEENSTYNAQYLSKKISNKLEIEEEVQYKRVTRTDFDNKDIKPAAINIIPNDDNGISIIVEKKENPLKIVSDEDLEFGTTALDINDETSNKPYLMMVSNNKRINITRDTFKLGRDSAVVDYAVANKAVGRVHGEIVYKNGQYYFIDNASINGSFINDDKIEPNKEYKIKHKDVIKLGNEKLIFKLY